MRSSWEVARGRAAGALAACAVLAGCASTVGPEALLRSHAYEGPRRSPRELATVFARFNTFDAGRAFVCAVDARPYRRDGVMSHCPSVVYVTPGVHALSVEYRWLGGSGRATVPADLRPGLLYEVTVFAPGTRHAEVMVQQLAPGSVLTYRDLAPAFFAQGDRADELVSHEPN